MSGVPFGLGQATRRVEDARFLTGSGRYTGDITLPGQAVAVVLRSPHAHAILQRIETSAAREMALGVFTIADLDADGMGDLPCKFLVRNRDGTRMTVPPRPVLARGRVRYVGEPVAFVVAETLEQAQDAAERVEVEYDPLPAVADMRDALAPEAPQLHGTIPGNQLFDWELGDEDATNAAFAGAARVVTLDMVNNRLAPTSLETRGVVASFDADSGCTTVLSGSQGSHTLREWLAEDVLHLPLDRLRLVSPDVGGGFGMRLFLYPEHALVSWAARRLGRPVKWIADRAEGFLADSHGRDHLSHAELALDHDGRFLALRVSTLANVGAALSQYGAFIPTHAGTGMLSGVYTLPVLYARVQGVLTNTAPVDAYRGAGRPEAASLIERLVDKAARALGLAPDEIRRRNFIPPEAMPYRTAGGKTYDSGDFARTLDDALRRADWAGFPARRAEAKARGRLRGIGLATYIESSGGSDPETAEVRVEADGRIAVLIGTQSTGQGHETAYAQMTAESLGISIARVQVIQGDTDRIATGGGTGASRSLPVGGAALAEAVEALIAAGKAATSQRFGGSAVSFADGTFHVGDSHLPLVEMTGLSGQATFSPKASTYPNGCHVSEVEVDPETGAVTLIAHTITDDVGVVVNPLLLEGQILGGAVQAIGQALLEEVVYDRSSGQLLTGSLIDYALPRADVVPDFRFATLNTPCRTNPLGIKGAGEAGTIGATPAVINAVVDALSPLGIDHLDMPATPLKVWQAIQDQGL